MSHRAIAEITTAGVLHRVDLLDAVVNLFGSLWGTWLPFVIPDFCCNYTRSYEWCIECP